ncbi:MAG: S9 family peptidase, partial [Acidobacteriota bacterium]
MKKSYLAIATSLMLISSLSLPAQTKRPLAVDDFASIVESHSPRLSPDGKWIVYSVSSIDLKEDKKDSNLWMASWDGTQSIQLTFSPKSSESTPGWSPDGRYIAFLSGREDEHDSDQLWLMNRLGGEAQKITDFAGGVEDYVFSPDGKQLALVIHDPDPDQTGKDEKKKTPHPIVVNRYTFKSDSSGYRDNRRRHIYLFDLHSRKSEALTSGDFDEESPSWSPDGKQVSFVSKRGSDPDRSTDWNVYVMEARPGSTQRQLTTFEGADSAPDGDRPVWSPDGKRIAYVQGGDPKLIYYAVRNLAVIPADGGAARIVTATTDRTIEDPHWSADGSSIYFLVRDDRTVQLASIPAAGGTARRVADGRHVVNTFDVVGGRMAVAMSTPSLPAEIFVTDGASFRRISHHNDAFLSGIDLAPVEEISFKSKDGTSVNGFLVKPVGYRQGTKVPTILRIHGGPVLQFGNDFSFEWQLLAANGYAVVAANPRGSTGRGEMYSRAIYADWGQKDVQDVLAAVDYAVERGIADPERLGIGGWSYGGMLTNYTIATDTRFKAATSGASMANILAGYGTDQYVMEYDYELGPPWEHPDVWMKLSFPFL